MDRHLLVLNVIAFFIGMCGAHESLVSYNAPSRFKDRYAFSDSEDRLLMQHVVDPGWNFSGKVFKNATEIFSGFSHVQASEAYSNVGEVSDSAGYWLKKNPLSLRDFCALSALMEQNEIVYDGLIPVNVFGLQPAEVTKDVAARSTQRHFLRYLAGRDFEFKTKTNKQSFLFNYASACWNEMFYLGFEFNLCRVRQDLEMVSVFSPSEASLVASDKQTNRYNTATSDFPLEYPNGLQSIFDRLMLLKNFAQDRNDETFTIGDSKFFINFPLSYENRRLGAFSMYVILGAQQQFNSKKIIQAFAGKPYRGPTVGASLGFVVPYSDLFNFHFYTHANYSFESLVMRRVPRFIDRKVSEGEGPMISGTDADVYLTVPLASRAIRFRNYSNVYQPDSTATELSDGYVSTRMRYGPEFGMQVGNCFNNLFSKDLSLDIMYRFNFKSNDVIGAPNGDYGYARDLITKDTLSISHAALARLNYRYNDSIKFFAGSSSVFAGRRCLKEQEFTVGILGVF
ncbi:hypothetical protein FJ366_00210 [Candidatus Dependentiae bacterium]|nr:hypothetical protein [Candidatus Dependentiae bacterium]